MSIMQWGPFDEIMSMRESMDRLFEDFFSRRPRTAGPLVWQPAVEIAETDNEVIVKAELPGIDPKNVEVSVTGEGLSIKGEAKAETEDRKRNYYRRELRYGMFQRTIALPTEVKSEETKATFRNGILEVRVPKADRVRPKTVKVEVEG
ncbi:MAG: Hsp20/alpha crystallin family protein [Armatimonadota bacterium]|nr:Hsp20/alpha crystallin family protein [Armatimonadota bacterium]MDR7423168.1 Hsp20/alpha crystallin family protein [Armatimonadota bacterium]MDR7455168.1 Hsp20/alpha crystallin family protein [Armatimonadota bacterium]MDR7510591.1 Hsp20/alpha crystallin family protein [Armatimonadota bacterium]